MQGYDRQSLIASPKWHAVQRHTFVTTIELRVSPEQAVVLRK